MTKLNVIGVDLAKNVIQVSTLSPSNRELRNFAFSRRKFAEFLGRQRPSLVAFEACATSHYWARVAQRHGHRIKIIPAKAVTPFRQGHKTDENDALAVAEAASTAVGRSLWRNARPLIKSGRIAVTCTHACPLNQLAQPTPVSAGGNRGCRRSRRIRRGRQPGPLPIQADR
jgi:transposase